MSIKLGYVQKFFGVISCIWFIFAKLSGHSSYTLGQANLTILLFLKLFLTGFCSE
jgi:hypothetical protein